VGRGVRTATRKRRHRTIAEILAHEFVPEDPKWALLMQRLRPVKRRRRFRRDEFLAMCYLKSPRAIHSYERNPSAVIARVSRAVFRTPSEQRRLALLDSLVGVDVPMASAILTLTDPRRYGVIDIRVWRLLYALGAVRTKPRGVGFRFRHWYHYLMKLRYHARQRRWPVRDVERTLFEYAKMIQARAYPKRKTKAR
jgi:hypothetical protein